MVKTRKELLNEIKKVGGVEKVALVSRAGMVIDGDDFEDFNTFSAMSAIILGAAETASMGIGTVKKVVVHLGNGKLFLVIPAGKKGVLVILGERDLYEELSELIGKFDSFI